MKVILAVVGIGLLGCDQLFGLGPVVVPPDAVSIADAGLDALGCPLPDATSFHDEDGDLIDDTCDNCPAIANPKIAGAQQDLDGDSVGDACDPHPSTKGDSIVEFQPFASGLGVWSVNGAGWTVSGDSITSPIGSTTSTKLQHPQLQADRPTLEVHLRVLDLGGVANTYGFWLHLISGASDATCNFDYDPVYGHELAALVNGGGNLSNYTAQTGIDYVMLFVRDTPTMSCSIDGETISKDHSISNVFVTPSISVDRMQVRIDSLVLYSYSPE